ncbi:hypothetical protein ACU686_12210 [Yinghuangia aomiensis]
MIGIVGDGDDGDFQFRGSLDCRDGAGEHQAVRAVLDGLAHVGKCLMHHVGVRQHAPRVDAFPSPGGP